MPSFWDSMLTSSLGDLILPFLAGSAGSLHCLGMCGPLLAAYSLSTPPTGTSWRGNILRHAAFHAGRVFIYGLLGCLAGGLSLLAGVGLPLFDLRAAITLAAGLVMVAAGLCLAGFIRLPAFPGWAFVERRFGLLLRSPFPGSSAVLGAGCGFLPCALSWSMVVRAAGTGRPLEGFLTMTAFGLGTVPLLLVAGSLASALSLKTRVVGERVAALAVLAMGLILAWKGVWAFV
jgi:sulfite exporter TauE/SafE